MIAHVRGAGEPPPHLVGHSYGGVLSLRIVQSALADVASLTLIEPGAYPLLDAAGETEALAEAEAINFGFIETAPRDPETAFRSYIDYYTDGPGSWDALPEKARARLLDIRENVVAGLAAVHAEPMPLDALSRISLPTRVLQGAATTRSHARICAVLARTIPGATLDLVDGAGHMLSMERTPTRSRSGSRTSSTASAAHVVSQPTGEHPCQQRHNGIDHRRDHQAGQDERPERQTPAPEHRVEDGRQDGDDGNRRRSTSGSPSCVASNGSWRPFPFDRRLGRFGFHGTGPHPPPDRPAPVSSGRSGGVRAGADSTKVENDLVTRI